LEEFHFQMYENSKHIWSNGNGPWMCACALMNAILAFNACNIRSCFKQAIHQVHCFNNIQTIVLIIISSSKVQVTKNLNNIPQIKCEIVYCLQFYVRLRPRLRPKSPLDERQIMENRLSFEDEMKTMSLLSKPLSHAHIVNNK
jgi:hypothetical protein